MVYSLSENSTMLGDKQFDLDTIDFLIIDVVKYEAAVINKAADNPIVGSKEYKYKNIKASLVSGKNAAQACDKICATYGEDTLSKPTARKWFARFRPRNFDVKDEPRSGRPITEKSDEIMEKVKRDKYVSIVEIARELGIDHKTVLNHLHKDGYKKKLDIWVPHELSVKNMMDRINICDTPLKRNEIEPFLKRMIIGDEKWIAYDNRILKRSWIMEEEKA
ncbi:PREDICTED: histone-lysine N-methyltransferase SETMAR-like [Acromyrmex echinatior]|uniref:histone-lysine N-methyltransferase SETMAR-like n=1 Tax=Acromyrmex echinatior TaxID=103372 RepID=UPI000580BCD3|nr:PREDICTED: histone-lysine N-methyltransferase SETMAR-like [Acromyrmex echinatior]